MDREQCGGREAWEETGAVLCHHVPSDPQEQMHPFDFHGFSHSALPAHQPLILGNYPWFFPVPANEMLHSSHRDFQCLPVSQAEHGDSFAVSQHP